MLRTFRTNYGGRQCRYHLLHFVEKYLNKYVSWNFALPRRKTDEVVDAVRGLSHVLEIAGYPLLFLELRAKLFLRKREIILVRRPFG